MDDQTRATASLRFSSRDCFLLLALVFLVVALRAWQLTHTEVAARDSIGYIRIAWHLEHEDLRTALRASDQHPLFPAAILAMSGLVRPWLPDDLPLAMQVSSQLVSALASLLLVVPMYLLGRELFDRRVSFFAVVLFQCLPAGGRVMGDGLSEPLFLLFVTTAFLAAAVGLRRGSPWAMALAGLGSGLAYLTRPEGGLIVVAAGLVLLSTLIVPRWRLPLGRWLACGVALALAAFVPAGPYMLTIGGVSVKPTAKNIIQGSRASDADKRGDRPAPVQRINGRRPLLFAAFAPSDANYQHWAFGALARSLVVGSFYFGWLPALLGFWQRRKALTHPGAWVLLAMVTILSLFLFKVAATMGYLSEGGRHTLVVLQIGTFWMAAGIAVLGAAAARLARWRWPRLAASVCGQEPAWTAVIFLAAAILPLWRTLAPLHGERAGFRQAGEWLARNVPAGDYVDDPYCWSHYFAGRLFEEGREDLPRRQPPVHYVVFESSSNKHARLHPRSEEQLRDQGGTMLASWPVDRGREHVEIRIYAVPGAFPPPRSIQPPQQGG